jgi:hypothetical protein
MAITTLRLRSQNELGSGRILGSQLRGREGTKRMQSGDEDFGDLEIGGEQRGQKEQRLNKDFDRETRIGIRDSPLPSPSQGKTPDNSKTNTDNDVMTSVLTQTPSSSIPTDAITPNQTSIPIIHAHESESVFEDIPEDETYEQQIEECLTPIDNDKINANLDEGVADLWETMLQREREPQWEREERATLIMAEYWDETKGMGVNEVLRFAAERGVIEGSE